MQFDILDAEAGLPLWVEKLPGKWLYYSATMVVLSFIGMILHNPHKALGGRGYRYLQFTDEGTKA